MRMNVVELSKRKGSLSALCLVALLSLVLGGCPPPSTRFLMQGGPSACTKFPREAKFEIHYINNTIIMPQRVCVQGGGTLNFVPQGDINNYYIGLCFTSQDKRGTGLFEGMNLNWVEVSSKATPRTLNPVARPSVTYTFMPCFDSNGNDDFEVVTGTLEVGTGGGTGEVEPPH